MPQHTPFEVGDVVRIVTLHDGLWKAPPETIAIYKNAFMRPLRVDGIRMDGSEMLYVELYVNKDGSQANDCLGDLLCVPPDEVERVERGRAE